PLSQLWAARCISNSTKPRPRVRRCAHRAVLTRCIRRRDSTLLGAQVRCCPPRNRKFGMLGIVTGSHAVPVLKKHVTVSADEDGAKGLIASFKCLARQLYTSLQKWAFICRDRILSHTISPILEVGSSSLSVAIPQGLISENPAWRAPRRLIISCLNTSPDFFISLLPQRFRPFTKITVC